MLVAPYNQFLDNCQESEINLDYRLRGGDHRNRTAYYDPNDWFESVRIAGELMAEVPNMPLTDLPITEPIFGRHLTMEQTALLGIINASHTKLKDTNPGTTFNGLSNCSIGNCSRAELYFHQTFKAMRKPGEASTYPYSDIGWKIITDGDNPIAVTKELGNRSSFSLEKFVINGIPYPAGSIFGIDVDSSYIQGPEGRSYIESSAITKIEFLRISLFAIPLRRRVFEFDDEFSSYTYADRFGWTVRRINSLSRKALSYSYANS